MNKRWKSSETAKYNIAYHLIWCPKYRKSVLINGVDERLKVLLNEKAQDLEIVIENMEVMPDHVHLFVKCKPTDNPQQIVGQLKGYASRYLRAEFPKLKSTLPCLWTRSFFCESVGHISEKTIKKYIEEQKDK